MCLPTRPTQRQTCGRSGAACVSASSLLPGNAPAGRRSAGREPRSLSPHHRPSANLDGVKLFALVFLLTDLLPALLILRAVGFPLHALAALPALTLLGVFWGAGEGSQRQAHPPQPGLGGSGGPALVLLSQADRSGDDTLPSIFLPISWNCFLFFLSSSSSRCRSSTSCCRRRKASASRSALDRNFGWDRQEEGSHRAWQ